MATPTIIPQMPQAQTASMMHLGMPVVGNNTGAYNVNTGGNPNNAGISALPMPGVNGRGGPGDVQSMVASTDPTMVDKSSSTGVIPIAGSINSGQGWKTTNQAQDTQKQFVDIYGKGVGGLINNQVTNEGNVQTETQASLIPELSGTGLNSGIMQNYDASLAPTLAANTATLAATLGNEGLGANSSTAALAQSNLVAQTQAQESGVAAELTQAQVQDQLALNQSSTSDITSLLQGSQESAQKETSSSGWNVFGDVLNAGAGLVGDALAGPAGSSILSSIGL